MSWRAWTLYLAVLVAAAFVTYRGALDNPLHLDDVTRIQENFEIRRLYPIRRFFEDPELVCGRGSMVGYMPLLPLSLAVDYALAGELDLARFRTTNLALLVLCGLLAAALARRLLARAEVHEGAAPLACLVGLWVVVHPVSGMLVHYVYKRDVLMMLAAMLGAKLAYLAMLEHGESARRWVGLVVLLAVAALASPAVAIFPAWAFLAEAVLYARPLRDLGLWRRVVGAGLVPQLLVWGPRLLGVGGSSGLKPDFARFVWAQPRAHVEHYLVNFFMPWRLRLAPGEPAAGLGDPWTWLAIVVLLAILLGALRVRAHSPLLAFLPLAYLCMLVPSSSLHPLPLAVVHYRPMAASLYLYLAVGWGLLAWRGPRVLAAVGGAATVALVVVGVRLGETWATPRGPWRQSVRYGGSALAYHGLALSYDDLEMRRGLLLEALEREPGYVLATMNLGLTEIGLGRCDEGLALCRRAVEMDPSRAASHYWLARGLILCQRLPEAWAAAEEAARLFPVQVEYRYLAGYLGLKTGHPDAARAHLEDVAQRAPGYRQVDEFRKLLGAR